MLSRLSPSSRWGQVPFALLNHGALGSIYAWSLLSPPLMRAHGVVAPSSQDWVASDVNLTFSLVMGGFAFGAVLARHLDKLGPNRACLIGASCLGGGFLLASQAVAMESLSVLYLGGAVWGVANGIAYTPPISTLTKWFPDRKGLASSLCVVGFGAGALVAAPLIQSSLKYFARLPEFVGKVSDGTTQIIYQNGKPFVELASQKLHEVVIIGQSSLSSGTFGNIAEGAYLVDTGSTGISETLALMGTIYGITMALSATQFRLPPPDYSPIPVSGVSSSDAEKNKKKEAETIVTTTFNVPLKEATLSKQFATLYLGFGISATGSLAYISSSAIVLNESFGRMIPDIVTPGFVATFVGITSAASLLGRLGWGYLSDVIAKRKNDPFAGRKTTYNILWGMTPLFWLGVYGSTTNELSTLAGPTAALSLFYVSSLALSASYGGSVSLRPPIIGDLFGLKEMTALTARQLSVVLPAAFAGPYLFSKLKDSSVREAAMDLTSKIDPKTFETAFGAPPSQLDLLLQTKAVTISRLMEFVPAGTMDPTPFMYQNGLLLFASFQVLALLSNIMLTPVDPALHEKKSPVAIK